MADNDTFLLKFASENGFHPDGLRALLAVIHGVSMRHSLSGDGPNLGAQQVVGGLWNASLERFGILGRDVLEHWGMDTPTKVGTAVTGLVQGGFLRGSEDEAGEYEALEGQFEWPEPPSPAPVRESVGWGGY